MTTRSKCPLLTLLGAFVLVLPQTIHSAASVLIWPLNPTVVTGSQATALWIENQGEHAVNLQIRALAWSQSDGQETFSRQQDLISTPPFTTIPPRSKQMVRLTHIKPVGSDEEQAYRLVIDELPPPLNPDKAPSTEPIAHFNVQMRYSLPVFVLGAESTRDLESAQVARDLRWSVVKNTDRLSLVVKNTGPRHARLAQVRLVRKDGADIDVAPGLLGYVLASREMHWPLPTPVTDLDGYVLEAQLKNEEEPVKLVPN